jgi:hypothetical protein
MKKIVRLTESDLIRLVKRVINEDQGKKPSTNKIVELGKELLTNKIVELLCEKMDELVGEKMDDGEDEYTCGWNSDDKRFTITVEHPTDEPLSDISEILVDYVNDELNYDVISVYNDSGKKVLHLKYIND